MKGLVTTLGMMAAQGGDGQEPVFHVMAVNDFACACTGAYGVIAATDNSVPSARRNALAELYYARLGAVSVEQTVGFSLLNSQG